MEYEDEYCISYQKGFDGPTQLNTRNQSDSLNQFPWKNRQLSDVSSIICSPSSLYHLVGKRLPPQTKGDLQVIPIPNAPAPSDWHS